MISLFTTDAEDTEAHDEMGFEDFFDLDVLRSHKGYHVLHMEEFLAKEGVSGGLKGKLPPGNSTEAWGPKLWKYLESVCFVCTHSSCSVGLSKDCSYFMKVADENPEWSGKFLAMPESPGDFNLNKSFSKPEVIERFKRFAGSRSPFFYDERLQNMHHIHVPGDSHHRILQHHYGKHFRHSQLHCFHFLT